MIRVHEPLLEKNAAGKNIRPVLRTGYRKGFCSTQSALGTYSTCVRKFKCYPETDGRLWKITVSTQSLVERAHGLLLAKIQRRGAFLTAYIFTRKIPDGHEGPRTRERPMITQCLIYPPLSSSVRFMYKCTLQSLRNARGRLYTLQKGQ